MKEKTTELFKELINLIYPDLCPCCLSQQPLQNHFICLKCLADLPFTDHYKFPRENEVSTIFWGRIPVRAATALLYFSGGGKTQQILYRIKYEKRGDIGREMGKLMGYYLRKSPAFENVDIILPIPLHPKKQSLRGFNQASLLAEGMSETMEIPWLSNVLKRKRNNPSQTKLSRENRITNSKSLFEVVQSNQIEGKNVLLVDDLVTTGATLESCGMEILEAGAKNLFISTLGCGDL